MIPQRYSININIKLFLPKKRAPSFIQMRSKDTAIDERTFPPDRCWLTDPSATRATLVRHYVGADFDPVQAPPTMQGNLDRLAEGHPDSLPAPLVGAEVY